MYWTNSFYQILLLLYEVIHAEHAEYSSWAIIINERKRRMVFQIIICLYPICTLHWGKVSEFVVVIILLFRPGKGKLILPTGKQRYFCNLNTEWIKFQHTCNSVHQNQNFCSFMGILNFLSIIHVSYMNTEISMKGISHSLVYCRLK